MFDFMDWGSWGVGDFYDAPYKELKEAIESGKDFDTGWHGWKKEIQSMRISREDGRILVEVSQEMDELPDLIYDCLLDEEEENLTDEMIEEITDYLAMETEFNTYDENSEVLPTDASLDEVIDKAKELMQECDNYLKDAYRICIGTTLQVMYPDKVENWEEMYLERCKRLGVGE